MKAKLRLFLLFFCLLPMALLAEEEKTYWGTWESSSDIIINKDQYSNQDIIFFNYSEGKRGYRVYTVKGLSWIAKITNDGLICQDGKESTQYYPNKAGFEDCEILLDNTVSNKFNLSAHYWKPIGNSSHPFKGVFNGAGCCITGLKINECSKNDMLYLGLFGYIKGAYIVELGIEIDKEGISGNVEATNRGLNIGGVAGYMISSSISSCYVHGEPGSMMKGNSAGSASIGGIAGYAKDDNNQIIYCYTMIDLTAGETGNYAIGGIIGDNFGSVTSCYALGTINCTNQTEETYAGGIVGYNWEGYLQNNLALNKGGIQIADEAKKTVFAARIGINEDGYMDNNYASANFRITGQENVSEDYENGILTKTDDNMEDLLGIQNLENSAWTYATDEGFLCLRDIDTENQPVTKLDRNIYVYGPLTLKDDLTATDMIRINYKTGSGWQVVDEDGKRIHSFNGEIAGGSITKGLFATGGTNTEPARVLNIIGDTKIETTENEALYVDSLLYLNVENGVNLNVKGKGGLYINEKAMLYLSQPGLKTRASDGITFEGTGSNGVHNYGKFYIDVNNLAIISSDDKYSTVGLANYNNIIYRGGSLKVEGVYSALGNGEDASFIAENLSSEDNIEFIAKNHVIINLGTINLEGDFNCSIKGDEQGILNAANSVFKIKEAKVTVESGGEYCISNKGDFSVDNNAVLNLVNKDEDKLIEDSQNQTPITVSPGSAIVKASSASNLPSPYALTYTSPSDGILSIVDKDGIVLESGVKINAGSTLYFQVKGNTRKIQYFVFSPKLGGRANKITPDINGKCVYTMQASDIEVSILFENNSNPTPDPAPTVYYTVTLPAVEGAMLDPGAGDYDVESWSTFRFYLTLAPEYDQSQPIVTTDRGETIAPRQSDGAYLVKYVRTDVAITIDGIVKNPDPVANDAVDADNITIRRTADGLLIHVPSPEALTLYTFAGTLVRTIHLPAGDTRIDVPTGTYIVRVGTKVEKVII